MINKKETEKFNALQNALGGIPLDPKGSENVCRAIKTIINLIDEKGEMTDREYIYGFIQHTLRPDGPYNELTKNERIRTAKLVLDHYGISLA